MEVYLSSGRRVPCRAACRDDGIQDAAGTLGQRADPDREEDSAARAQERSAISREAGILVSPDRKSELSLNGGSFGSAAVSDGYSVFPVEGSDALHRPPPVSGFDIFHFEFLPRLSARAVSEDLGAGAALLAIFDGTSNWADGDQYVARER